MKTAKALGFKKGDLIHTGVFPGIIVGDAHTATPLCEVWGIEHEMGSAYAADLRKMSYDVWLADAKAHGFNGMAYSEVSKAVLKVHKVLS